MVSEGHQLASHSNSHPNMPDLDRDAMRADIGTGFDALRTAAEVDTKVFSGPRTVRSANSSGGTRADLIDMNVLWDIDTLDWKRPGAEADCQDGARQRA